MTEAMVILGLTGSIGMGKTTAAQVFRRFGVPVHDADAAVHTLFGQGGAAVAPIAATFDGAVRDGVVDRQALGRIVFEDPVALKRLEAIVHPLVSRSKHGFLRRAAARRKAVVVLDIPLLYETGGERQCDAVVVVSAPHFVQEARVLARAGMTRDKLDAVLARQTPDAEKRRRADFIIPTGNGRRYSLNCIHEIIVKAESLPGRHWPPRIVRHPDRKGSADHA